MGLVKREIKKSGEKMHTKIFNKIFTTTLLSFLLLTACGSASDSSDPGATADTSVNNSEKVVTASKVVNGRSTITIPLNVFDNSLDELDGSNVLITLGDNRRFGEYDSSDLYHEDSQSVKIVLTNLEDQLSFDILITIASSQYLFIHGEFSSTSETTSTPSGGAVTGI
jgi:hypothetical protein